MALDLLMSKKTFGLGILMKLGVYVCVEECEEG